MRVIGIANIENFKSINEIEFSNQRSIKNRFSEDELKENFVANIFTHLNRLFKSENLLRTFKTAKMNWKAISRENSIT